MIELQNVSLVLGGKTILDNVSITIDEGSTFVILGPSGAGKSTILKAILGLFKVDSGKVLIEGNDLTSLAEKDILEIRRKMGIVFQGNALFDSLTVAQNTAYFLSDFSKLSKEQIDNKVKEVLSFVNLEGTEDLYPDQLSGGMKKRLAIARALATDPKIILFDEPTTGLDPINSKAVLDLVQRLKSIGTTSVIVTHILSDAVAIGDVLTVINEGHIVASGSVKEILKSKNQFVRDFFFELYQDVSLIEQNER